MRIVTKPWGHETIWAECDSYVGKLLHIKPDCRLSRQYHEIKEETIMVQSGLLRLEVGREPNVVTYFLKPGETYHVLPFTVHRFCADKDPVVLIEVSTPHLDDVVRISDDYKRLDP
jgi:quercetin dioxygenase-like cupin family protein